MSGAHIVPVLFICVPNYCLLRFLNPISIEKVAQLAGVSKATVSRVLNAHPGVKPDTREKVLAAISACDYQPNLLARQLRTSQSNMLLVLISDITNPFCSRVVQGIAAEADLHGYHILLCTSASQHQREAADLSRSALITLKPRATPSITLPVKGVNASG